MSDSNAPHIANFSSMKVFVEFFIVSNVSDYIES